MKPIYKFILHVTHNLFPLNEYSEGEIKRLMDKFKEEADDLNITITDNQLKNYITRFDQLKNSPKITEKDLRKYSLSKLIKLVTSSKGKEDEEEDEEDTPDVVYNENGITIYNGSKEDNCLTYGMGERWCITKGSFSNYRYDSNRKNPTFYLVKDTNLPDSNPQSFFVVVVGSDNTYKVSDRTNNDVGGTGTEWDRWENWNFVGRHFPSIVDLHHIFKYVPLSSKEKLSHTYKTETMSFREWLKQPFSFKEQYLVLRKGNDFFNDITNEEFIIKFIPQLPAVAHILAKNNDIAGSPLLLKTIEYFNKQDQNSIISNLRDPISSKYLNSETISFDIKKLLVKLNKWKFANNMDIYVTKDGSAIVTLLLTDQIHLNLYTEDDTYLDIKLNNRTSKYLLDYPKLEELPFHYLLDLIEKGVVGKDIIDKVINNLKEKDDVIIKTLNNKEIIIDYSSFNSYIINNGKIEKVPFNNEEVQTVFNELNQSEKSLFTDSVINLFFNSIPIPNTIDINTLKSIINNIPYSSRVKNYDVLLTSEDSIFTVPSTIEGENGSSIMIPSSKWNNAKIRLSSIGALSTEELNLYWNYLNSTNQKISNDQLYVILNNQSWKINQGVKKAFIDSNPPLNPDNDLVPKVINGKYILINKLNPSQSYVLSDSRNKLNKLNLPARKVAALLGTEVPPEIARVRRGRPARGENEPIRRGRPVGGGRPIREPQVQGDIDIDDLFTEQGLIRGYEGLPRGVRSRLGNQRGQILNLRANRGAARRQNMLGNLGVVENVIQFGRSTVYIIRLPNNNVKIASIVIQPGNQHYVVSQNENHWINSPSELVSSLRNQNLLEIRNFIIYEYIGRNPNQLNEIKRLIKQQIQETKNS